MDVSIIKNEEYTAIGAEIAKYNGNIDGKPIYEPYMVASLYYRAEEITHRQALISACSQISQLIDDSSKLIVFKSPTLYFSDRRGLRNRVGIAAMKHGREVRFNRIKPRIDESTKQLAFDAIQRGESLITLI